MSIHKGDDGWKRAISDACRVTVYGAFKQKDDIYAIDYDGVVSYIGQVAGWGEYWDFWERLPTDWRACVPYTYPGYEDIRAIEINYARARPPELDAPVVCSKPACAKGRCAGKDWCMCPCNHWWMS